MQRSLTTLDQKIEKVRKKRKAEVRPLICFPSAELLFPGDVSFYFLSTVQEKASVGEEDSAVKKETAEEEDVKPCDDDTDDEDEFNSDDERVLTQAGKAFILKLSLLFCC